MALPSLPPPHPAPHAPTRLSVPAGACDAHCHIFGPVARFPYVQPRPYEPAELPLERYRAMADRLGLERAVFVQPVVYGTDHAAIVDALEREPGRYGGVGLVNDSLDDAALERMHVAGFRGARFNFVGRLGIFPAPDEIRRTYDRVKRYGWHLVFHFDDQSFLARSDFLASLPCAYVIDHMARPNAALGTDQPGFAKLLELAATPRCHVKISAADRVVGAERLEDGVRFMRALADAAPERTLWGTDWPHPNTPIMPDDGDLIDLLAIAVPDVGTREAILVANPARLYDFE
ncbi:amidohydrolase [Sphingomonas sp.]|uniref:amidohydrolase family protein n=1 Tax=Sphingomonas sp. TaxID=28214 RepID=UPI0025E29F52|nr:amidohydrolase family protein [Sphingomonas sp.]